MIPTFSERAKQWAAPPVDDIGYLLSDELLTWDDEALLDLINEMSIARYEGWRNWEMRWRTVLQLDTTRNKEVLDYGCGVGLEALQYAKLGNIVSLADIAPSNVKLANRILQLAGYKTKHSMVIKAKPPFLPEKKFDIIHCAGVLHHIPEPKPVVEAMHGWLNDGGELRLMLYSDEAWRIATRTDINRDFETKDLIGFEAFWQHWDPIGGYADWYDRQKLEEWYGEWFHVSECKALTKHGEYLGAILVKR